MNTEKVYSIFSRLSGLRDKELLRYTFLCETSAGYVVSRLRDKEAAACSGGKVEFAAAALAYYRYILCLLTDGETGEVKVGDIAVKKDAVSILESAEKLCREAFRDISGLLAPEDFYFRGV